MSKIAHKLVAKTAYDIACEVYEVLASNSKFYQAYPTMDSFVSTNWSQFIGDARRALAQMLKPEPFCDPAHPVFRYSEHIRNEVFEALCLEGGAKGTPN